MKLLLIESATAICSVAVADEQRVLSRVEAQAPHQHASHLTCLIETAVADARMSISDLTHLVLGHGPGSYTGLRVGAAVAKGLCLARPEITFLTVSSMEALAGLARQNLNLPEGAMLYPTVDSRRGEVYTQPFDRLATSLAPIRAEILVENPFQEVKSGQPGVIVGTGTNKVASTLANREDLRFHPEILLSAADLYPLARTRAAAGDSVNFADYEPLYIKPPFVTKSTKKLL